MNKISPVKKQRRNSTACPRRRSLLACASAVAFLCAAACASTQPAVSATAPIIPSSAAIWLHPLPSASAWPGGPPYGSADFLALFQADAPWPRALAKTQVIGLYAGWITDVSDEELQAVVSFLNEHNLAIEIEAPALQAQADCGSGLEGYVPYGLSVQTFTLAYLQRLQSFGAQKVFVKVDEPYFFGSVANTSLSCHFTVFEVASQVGQFEQLVKSVYPNAAVGDVEPIIAGDYTPNVVTAIERWHDVYAQTTGSPFPFFVADTDFSNPAWPALVKKIEVKARQQGSAFGIIYIGDPQDTSDAEWAGKAVSRFRIYQGWNGGRPNFVLFQSWEPHPVFCLPETNPTTFTGILDAYIDETR